MSTEWDNKCKAPGLSLLQAQFLNSGCGLCCECLQSGFLIETCDVWLSAGPVNPTRCSVEEMPVRRLGRPRVWPSVLRQEESRCVNTPGADCGVMPSSALSMMNFCCARSSCVNVKTTSNYSFSSVTFSLISPVSIFLFIKMIERMSDCVNNEDTPSFLSRRQPPNHKKWTIKWVINLSFTVKWNSF